MWSCCKRICVVWKRLHVWIKILHSKWRILLYLVPTEHSVFFANPPSFLGGAGEGGGVINIIKFPQMTGQDKRLDYNMMSVNIQLVKHWGPFTIFWHFLAWYAVLEHLENLLMTKKFQWKFCFTTHLYFLQRNFRNFVFPWEHPT